MKLKFLYFKGHDQVSEKTVHRMGENICKLCVSYGSSITQFKIDISPNKICKEPIST